MNTVQYVMLKGLSTVSWVVGSGCAQQKILPERLWVSNSQASKVPTVEEYSSLTKQGKYGRDATGNSSDVLHCVDNGANRVLL